MTRSPYDPFEDFSRRPARPLQEPTDTTWTPCELFQLEDDVGKPLEKPNPDDETTTGGWCTG